VFLGHGMRACRARARVGEDGSMVAVFEVKQTVGRFVFNYARRGPTACFRGTSALWKNRQSVGGRTRKSLANRRRGLDAAGAFAQGNRGHDY
jgi:hypothetical protein